MAAVTGTSLDLGYSSLGEGVFKAGKGEDNHTLTFLSHPSLLPPHPHSQASSKNPQETNLHSSRDWNKPSSFRNGQNKLLNR